MRFSKTLIALAAACVIFASGMGYAGQRIIKTGHVVTEDSSFGIGMAKLDELLQKRTDGRYKLKIYPNSQLGGERDLVEGVQLGSIGMAVSAGAVVANFVPSLNLVELPYLFTDYTHADRVFLGDIGKQLMHDIDAHDMKCVAIWEVGFRNLSNNRRPIHSAEDIKGMKIRTMETKMHQELWRALGADPVPMSWTEAYTAMQQGAVDGVETPTLNTYTLKVQEVCKYFALTEQIYTSAPVLLSNRIWNAMSAEDQKIFLECADEAGRFQRDENRRLDKEAEKGLADAGMEVTHPDKHSFVEATKPVYAAYEGQFGDMVRQIQELAK